MWDDEPVVYFDEDEYFSLSSSELIAAIAAALERICTKGEFFGRSSNIPTCFVSTVRPKFSLSVYLEFVMENVRCSKAAFVLALIYLDRFSVQSYDMDITYCNIHRLFVVALVLAIKYVDDSCYKLSWYARIGGLTDASELRTLEAEFLRLLNYNVYVSQQTYEVYKENLTKILAADEAVGGRLRKGAVSCAA